MRIDASDIPDLRPVIEAAVVATLERLRESELARSDRLAYSEPEASAMLGIRPHCLRDARLRGEIDGCRLGKRTCYTREALLKYLERQKI